ncbi:MAG: methyltransferase [Sphingorhabdus sp.]
MKNHLYALAALSLAVAATGCATAGQHDAPAIDNSARPAADVKRDAVRQPAEMMKFAKIGAGQTVVDMLPGGGYFTRVFSQAVGPEGKVVALVSEQYAKRFPKMGKAIKDLAAEPAYSNVEAAIRFLGNVGAPNSVDRVWTAQNYHDLKSSKLPAGTAAAINSAVFAALKPGGYYVILDHSAEAGSGARDVDTLHRIDAEALKAEVVAAGFVFDGESKLLANAADDRSVIVFNPAVRGKTDQFVFRFKKPE